MPLANLYSRLRRVFGFDLFKAFLSHIGIGTSVSPAKVGGAGLKRQRERGLGGMRA